MSPTTEPTWTLGSPTSPTLQPLPLQSPEMFRKFVKWNSRSPFRTQVRTQVSMTDWEKITPRKEKHSKGLIALLVLMPVISFGLGTWQVKRLAWKQELIASAEDQLSRPPLALPSNIDSNAVQEFNYRRVSAAGEWDHEHEMLVGPRLHKGQSGYFVVTPLRRKNGSTLLINRGWISQNKRDQRSRPDSLTRGQVLVDCLLRSTPKSNTFTPQSETDGEYHFMDIADMSKKTGAQPVYLERIESDSGLWPEQEVRAGIPLGFPAKVEFRNTHFQYIVTWYGLCILTGIMLTSVLRQNSKQRTISEHIKRKAQHARQWQ